MKNGPRFWSLLMLFSIGLFLVSCDEESKKTSEEETQLNKLKSTWTLTAVDNDDDDRFDEYPGMTFTISGSYAEAGTYNYTSSATDWPPVSPWKKEDQWKFKTDQVASTVVRQTDLLEMSYALSNNDNTLTISFNYPSSGTGFSNSGRTGKVSGAWRFTFSK